jgi:hypothetical protein
MLRVDGFTEYSERSGDHELRSRLNIRPKFGDVCLAGESWALDF